MNWWFVTCFRDVTIHIIAVSRTLHSSNHNAFMVKKYRKWLFWELSNRFWRCNITLSQCPPLYLYTAGHGPTDFLNCDNSTVQDETLQIMIIRDSFVMYIPLMIDFINLHLYAFLSMAIFTPQFLEKLLYELNFSKNNKFCNVFLNIVESPLLLLYPKLSSLRNDYSIDLNLSDDMWVFAEKYDDCR